MPSDSHFAPHSIGRAEEQDFVLRNGSLCCCSLMCLCSQCSCIRRSMVCKVEMCPILIRLHQTGFVVNGGRKFCWPGKILFCKSGIAFVEWDQSDIVICAKQTLNLRGQTEWTKYTEIPWGHYRISSFSIAGVPNYYEYNSPVLCLVLVWQWAILCVGMCRQECNLSLFLRATKGWFYRCRMRYRKHFLTHYNTDDWVL